MLGPLVTCGRRQKIVTWIYQSRASRKYWSADRIIVNIMQHFTWNNQNYVGNQEPKCVRPFLHTVKRKGSKRGKQTKTTKVSITPPSEKRKSSIWEECCRNETYSLENGAFPFSLSTSPSWLKLRGRDFRAHAVSRQVRRMGLGCGEESWLCPQ